MNESGTETDTEGLPLKCAITNTGPMISIFQSEQVGLLKALYDRVCIPASELPEYERHGAGFLIKRLIDSGFVLVYTLAEAEEELAKSISEEIARHPLAKDKDPQSHYPEGEAMAFWLVCGQEER